MMRLLVLAGLVLFGATLHRVAVADDGKDRKAAQADPTAALLAKLREPLTLPPGEMTLTDFAAAVEKATGVGVVVNEAAFRSDAGSDDPDMLPARPTRFKGATAAAVLKHTLAKHRATYLVRRDHIEIVPAGHARRETRQPVQADELNGETFLPLPLVSAVVRERPLNEVLAELAAEHDLTVIVAPQAADQKAAFVSARLLNVPADRAVELLALQADLRVVRRGAAFLVTSREHAEGLFAERMDREQRKAEVENLRRAPQRSSNVFCGGPGGGMLPVGFGGTPAAFGGGIGFGGAPAGFGGGIGFAGAPGGTPPAQPPAPPARP